MLLFKKKYTFFYNNKAYKNRRLQTAKSLKHFENITRLVKLDNLFFKIKPNKKAKNGRIFTINTV